MERIIDCNQTSKGLFTAVKNVWNYVSNMEKLCWLRLFWSNRDFFPDIYHDQPPVAIQDSLKVSGQFWDKFPYKSSFFWFDNLVGNVL